MTNRTSSDTFTVEELAELTQRSVPMIRHYIRRGVLAAELDDSVYPPTYRIPAAAVIALKSKPRIKSGPRKP
jgi:hypothetical protein